jgi:uncharacterized membrane protein
LLYTPEMRNFLPVIFIAAVFACNNAKPDNAITDSTVTELITDSITASSQANEPTADLLQQKINAGIEFYGIGQEPGWSLNMDMENMFSFKSYDGVEMNTPPVAGVNEGGVTLYRMQVEMGEMIITLVEMECTDVMSGQKFPFQVRVSIKRGVDSVFREYEGCGKMLK